MGELLSAWQAVSRRRARRSAGNTIFVQTQPYQNRDRVGEDRIICSGKVQQSFIKQSMIDSKGKGSECHYFCASRHNCSVNYLCDDMSSQYGGWNKGKMNSEVTTVKRSGITQASQANH